MTNRWLDEIQPDRPEDIPPRQELPKAQAEVLGFPSREPVVRRKRQASSGPTDQLNLRASIEDINAFVSWCERNRYSNREGFHELVKLIASK